MNKNLIIVAIMLASASGYSQTQNQQVPIGFLVDRLTLRMTGMPATPEQIESVASGKQSIVQLANEIRRTGIFERRLIEYWAQRLELTYAVGWTGRIGIPAGYDSNPNNPRKTSVVANYVFKHGQGGRAPKTNINWKYNRTCKDLSEGRFPGVFMHTKYTNCSCKNYLQEEPTGLDANGELIPPAILVVPWWNKSSEVLTCKESIEEDVCGPGLIKCIPYGENRLSPTNYVGRIDRSITLEPAAMAAKLITEDKDWRLIFTSTKGVINSAFFSFIANEQLSWIIRDTHPPGSYPDLEKNPLYKTILANTGSAALIDPEDPYKIPKEFVWIEKGENHAGVLTMPGFQINNNGHRALADAARSNFLCREFVVPEGVRQVVSSEPDLTKKPYCRACHATLEPLADFFGRWPAVGERYYYYKNGKYELDGRGNARLTENGEKIVLKDAGSYAGQSGNGAVGLGQIFANEEDLSVCAVKQAFEFLVGRPMNESETSQMLRPLKTKFVQGGYKVWPIMLEVINSKSFLGTNAKGER